MKNVNSDLKYYIYFTISNFSRAYIDFFPSFSATYDKSKTNLGDFLETPETPLHSGTLHDNSETIPVQSFDNSLMILWWFLDDS